MVRRPLSALSLCSGTFLSLCGQSAAQQLPAHVRAVRADAPPGGNGQTWATAYGDLQEALGAAAGSAGQITELWLAQGTYKPPVGSPCSPFEVANVSLYGGFEGNEVLLSQRPAGTISELQGQQGCSSTNGPALVEINTTAPVTLDGFRVSGSYNGGINIQGPITLGNVTVEWNYAFSVRKLNPAPLTVDGCTFRHGGLNNGGVPVLLTGPGTISSSTIHCSLPFVTAVQLSNLSVRDSVITTSTDGHGVLAGGVSFQRCTINAFGENGGLSAGSLEDCSATGSSLFGTGVSVGTVIRSTVSGGSSFTMGVSAGSIIDSQVSASGGGASMSVGATVGSIERSRLTASGSAVGLSLGTAINSWVQFSGRTGAVSGGGVNSVFIGGGSEMGMTGSAPHFVNCLFNVGSSSAPGFQVEEGWRFTNCIIWRPYPGVTEATTFAVAPGVMDFVNYSCVRGWTGLYGGMGNISADPLLNADGTLQPGSPCIDAGTMEVAGLVGERDRIGNCRISDGDLDGSRIVDMGAHEFTTCWVNCDCSTTAPVLNVGDFSCFLQRFGAGDPWANCDESWTPPVLNTADFSCFLQRFATGCP